MFMLTINIYQMLCLKQFADLRPLFKGIHDDGCHDGLAAKVRNDIPEDTAIIELDSGDIDCNGDR